MTNKQLLINENFKRVAILEYTGDHIFSQIGLTVKTYGILYLISTGLNTSKDLLNGTYGSKPNMAKKLKFLEDGGFIERRIDKNDRRIFRFSLTSKAGKAMTKISPIYENAISAVFKGVSKEEIITTLSTIQKCLKNMENHPKVLIGCQ